MPKTYKFCQSCGMPFSQDPEKCGTNKDGSRSKMYCSYCYKEGKFLGDATTAKEMQDFCITMMKKQGMPGPVAWLMTRGIPRLERWKNNK